MTKNSDEDKICLPGTIHPAALAEADLLADCEVRRQRRSGPGGQHRNKVETAVVITHQPTGLQGEASERRSQDENRQRALFRLRINLALHAHLKVDFDQFVTSDLWKSRCRDGRISISAEHRDFPAVLAEAFDVLTATELDAKRAAELLGCSSSQLVRLIQQEPKAIQLVNDQRRARGKGIYR